MSLLAASSAGCCVASGSCLRRSHPRDTNPMLGPRGLRANQQNAIRSPPTLGLAANHYLLDIGCGCLRGGQFASRILEPEHYYGTGPNQWLIDDGIKHQLGAEPL